MNSSLLGPMKFLGREYESPIWAASGCYGWYVEAQDGEFLPQKNLGAVVLKGLSFEAERGAPQPRIWEMGEGLGLVNAIGLQNPGFDKFKTDYLNRFLKTQKPKHPLWLNIYGKKTEEYVKLIKSLVGEIENLDVKGSQGVFAGFEINISCPNVEKGGLEFSQDLSVLNKLLTEIKLVSRNWPILVKFSAAESSSGILEKAKICADSGISGITLCNTLPARPPKGKIGRGSGGLSGPTLKLQSLRLIESVAGKCGDLKIVACGGIDGLEAAGQAQSAGAEIFQVGTQVLRDPWFFDRLK